MEVRANIPQPFEFLFKPSRYKCVKGGRGKGASWSIARALLIKALQSKTRILCTREVQKSIRESVHRLLKNQIQLLGVEQNFTITQKEILCQNGSDFIFEGIYQNVDRIRSLEGVDICWIEEAHSLTKESFKILTPTIRKENSEIWMSWNPKYEDDFVNQFAANPPPDAVIKHINYDENPYFPSVLRKEMEHDKNTDRLLYEHIWLGKPTGTGRKVWGLFDRDVHVKEFKMEDIAEEGNCFMSMDPHSHYYPFVVWFAIMPKNRRKRWPEDFHKHIYAEWPTFDQLGGYYHDMRKKLFYQGTIGDMVKELYAADGIEHGVKVYDRFIDTRFAKGSGSWSWSTKTQGIVSEFAKKENGGMLLHLPPEAIIDVQREVVKNDMMWNKAAPINEFNEPSFSVSPLCRNTIASLSNHRLEEDSEKENDKYKEASDCIRICYAGLNNFEYEVPVAGGTEEEYYRPRAQGRTGWMG